MPKVNKDKPRPKKKANGYRFPEKLPQGLVLKDTAKREWKLGTSIGQGGFGEIYCASALGSSLSTAEPYVIKIEPHENGPLFVEKNFYIKIARPEEVENWRKQNGIKILGIPTFHGSGSHEYKAEKYRFIVIERYGKDLWNIFLSNKKKFPAVTVYKCALQILDILHYIHDKGYVHGDIKGANLLLGLKKGTENNVFLVDFGLACKYNTKEFKKDPKKAHNGTIEYTSRDWHIGVPTRRGDLEILGYNLLHWLGSTLPWEKDIKNPEAVYEKKRDLMEHVKEFMKKNYPQVPKVLTLYLDYVFNLKPDDPPDYVYCKELFLKELKSLPGSDNGKLDFTSADHGNHSKSTTPKKIPIGKRKSLASNTDDKENCTKSVTPKKTPLGKRRAVATGHINSDSDNNLDDSLTPKKARENSDKKEIPARKPQSKPRGKKTETKSSWRDAPTAQASKVVKAGVYEKVDKPVKKKVTKN